jgi:hypothetical protein
MTAGSAPGTHVITPLEGNDVMARIVEFYIPADFKPKIKCVPQDEQGRLVVFPSNLKKPA